MKADTSIAEAVRLGTTNFGLLNAGRGNTQASQKILSVLLLNLLDFFTAEWNLVQLEDCVEIIATEYYWFTQAEFKIFTLRCKKGYYGTDYGKLSPQRLLIWLEEFSQECRYERAGIRLLQAKFSEPISASTETCEGFNIKPMLKELKDQLVLQIEVNAKAEVARQDENIRKYQIQLRERWRGLERCKADQDSKKGSPPENKNHDTLLL